MPSTTGSWRQQEGHAFPTPRPPAGSQPHLDLRGPVLSSGPSTERTYISVDLNPKLVETWYSKLQETHPDPVLCALGVRVSFKAEPSQQQWATRNPRAVAAPDC